MGELASVVIFCLLADLHSRIVINCGGNSHAEKKEYWRTEKRAYLVNLDSVYTINSNIEQLKG